MYKVVASTEDHNIASYFWNGFERSAHPSLFMIGPITECNINFYHGGMAVLVFLKDHTWHHCGASILAGLTFGECEFEDMVVLDHKNDLQIARDLRIPIRFEFDHDALSVKAGVETKDDYMRIVLAR